jgi:hypothetical protein
MSAISERIDVVVREGLNPILKALGYRKSARTWRHFAAGCIRVVNLQGSWTNAGDSGSFTINLGVYYPAADVIAQRPARARATDGGRLRRARADRISHAGWSRLLVGG